MRGIACRWITKLRQQWSPMTRNEDLLLYEVNQISTPPRIFKIHILIPKHWYILDNCKLNSFGATAFLALRSGSCSGASPAALCAGNASTQHFVSWANSVHLHHICGYCGRFGHFGHWSLVIAANRGNCEDCPPHVDFLLKNHEIYTQSADQPISIAAAPLQTNDISNDTCLRVEMGVPGYQSNH